MVLYRSGNGSSSTPNELDVAAHIIQNTAEFPKDVQRLVRLLAAAAVGKHCGVGQYHFQFKSSDSPEQFLFDFRQYRSDVFAPFCDLRFVLVSNWISRLIQAVY